MLLARVAQGIYSFKCYQHARFGQSWACLLGCVGVQPLSVALPLLIDAHYCGQAIPAWPALGSFDRSFAMLEARL